MVLASQNPRRQVLSAGSLGLVSMTGVLLVTVVGDASRRIGVRTVNNFVLFS